MKHTQNSYVSLSVVRSSATDTTATLCPLTIRTYFLLCTESLVGGRSVPLCRRAQWEDVGAGKLSELILQMIDFVQQ